MKFKVIGKFIDGKVVRQYNSEYIPYIKFVDKLLRLKLNELRRFN